ncbi:MAG: aconitase X swivel domain-containing protein [Planctomycetota bacterium]
MERILNGRPIVAGQAEGCALVSKEPLSFWGGLCPRTGEIIDRRHERSGAIVTGRVFVFPQGKGSSTSSAVLLESIKTGVAPAAIINLKVDSILALGSIVSDELYRQAVPIVVLPKEDFFSIKQDDYLTIEPDGTVKINMDFCKTDKNV